MKFERVNTKKSKRRLNFVFYFSFILFFLTGILRLLSGQLNLGIVVTIFNYLSILGLFFLMVVYLVHIFIEGLEKPKVIPTETHSKLENENASKSDTNASSERRPF